MRGQQIMSADQTAMPKKRWYVVHAYSGFEKYVMQALQERIRLEGLEDKFGEILVPTEEVVELRGGQKRKSERKFFPGYVLVEMIMDEKTWHLVRSTPKVLGFIGGTSDKPAPISPKEAEKYCLKWVKWFASLTVPLLISMALWKKLTTKRIDYVLQY
jgi:transcription antitermination factor NusG